MAKELGFPADLRPGGVSDKQAQQLHALFRKAELPQVRARRTP